MTPAGLSHRRAIIVGAGQSGLAVAAALIGQGLRPQQDFVMIDAAPAGQRSWSSRWHSLTLLSDAGHSALPHHRIPGDPARHLRGDEIADYLDDVQRQRGVKPVWDVRATRVERRGTGPTLQLSTTVGDVQTRNVVCAAGAAAHPRVPAWAASLQLPGAMMHSGDYRYPRQIPPGDVLIVGGGNSGVQIARDLLGSHTVTLSVRAHRGHLPLAAFPAEGRARAWLRRRRPEPVFGDSYQKLRRAGVRVTPEVTGADSGTVMLADGTRIAPRSVVLATGFEPADDWLPDPVRTTPARFPSTAMPGLFVAGIPRYSRPGADTLDKVSRDATVIARKIADRP